MANKKIQFKLTAVDKTKAAFDKVGRSLKAVGGGALKAAKLVGGIGLAAAGAATAIALLVKQSFDFIDTIGKTSARTGIATDTLQAFQLAAIESGTTVEQTQKGLEKFARSIGDAGRGLKTQIDIFKDLGVSIENSDGTLKTFEEILFEVAEGLGKLGSEAERATALANLFGRAGIQFSEIFRDGADGLNEFIKRANDLGIILDERTIKAVEKFNDTVSVIKLQIGALKNNITGAFVPALQLIADKLRDTITAGKNSAEGFDVLGKAMAVSILEGTKVAVLAIESFLNRAKQAFLTFAASRAGEFFGLQLTDVEKLQVELINLEREIGNITDKLNNSDKRLQNQFSTRTDAFVQKNANMMAQLSKARDRAREIKEELGDNVPKQSENVLNFLNEMLAAVKEGNPEVIKLFESLEKGLTDQLDPVAKFKAQLDDVTTTLDNIAVNSMKKLEDAIVQGLQTGKLAFKDFATYVVEQLVRVAIQQLIVARLIDPFRAMITPPDLNAFANAATTLASADGGGYTGMGVRAGGIDGKGGFPAILHPNETVIDHTKGQGMGTTVNFNISTVDAAGFDQLLASRKGLITSIINNAMNNQGKMGVV